MDEESSRQTIVSLIEQKMAILREAKRRYYADNLYAFNEEILGWPDLDKSLHGELCTFTTEGKSKKLILIPRGHLKSSVITVGYTLQQICKNPKVRILIANATYQMAKTFLSQIKYHLQKNEKLKDLYGDLTSGADKWSESAITVTTPDETAYLEKKEPTVTVFGIGGSLTGQHYDIIILDDLVNRDNISTKDQIEKVKLFYKDCQPLLEKPHGRMLIVGTRWDYADLYGWIMESPEIAQDFDIMVKRAYEGDFGKGTILFPKKFTWSVFEETRRQMGSAEFSSQYLNDPVDSETASFRRGWLKYYEDADVKGVFLNIFMTIDPAISEEKSSDYTAMVVVGVDEFNNWYILEVVREHYNPSQLINKVFDLYRKYTPLEIGLEQVAFQKALRFYMNEEMRKNNVFLPIKELKVDNQIGKDVRIRGLIPRYENGTIFHRKGAFWVDNLEDELLRFPKTPHDDIIDALSYQLQLTFPRKRKITNKENHYLY